MSQVQQKAHISAADATPQSVRVGGLQDVNARQAEVLDAALTLLAQEGAKLTMSGVARAASCSKETLYKWFGDRAGLLTAVVQWQASRVVFAPVDREGLSRSILQERLEEFARNLLSVLSSKMSVALNRTAIGMAHQQSSEMGQIVLENGRRAIGKRLKPALEAGKDAGILHFAQSEEAFRTFFGLVVRDVQIRFLLGDDFSLSQEEISADAQRAADQFFALYGAKGEGR